MREFLRIGGHDLKTGPLTNRQAGGEGTVGLSDETRARMDFELHSPDAPGERGIANRFFFELTSSVRSVPIRPLNETARPRPLEPVPYAGRRVSLRQAAALAASAIANRLMIAPGTPIPRRLTIEGAPLIIEYGACKDILRSGMAEHVNGAGASKEHLVLTELGYEAVGGREYAAGVRREMTAAS